MNLEGLFPAVALVTTALIVGLLIALLKIATLEGRVEALSDITQDRARRCACIVE